MRYVYFMQAATAANLMAVKIGIARNPRSRIKELQCGSPTKIRLLAFVEGDQDLERRLHLTFAEIGLHGEWFARVGKLRDFLGYVEDYAEENGCGGEISIDQFEIAIGDVVANQSWMPVMPETEEEYEATADRSLWVELA